MARASSARAPGVTTPARRKDGDVRREALLDAALRCFADKGVLATGIEDIRRAAGASPSSVYNLFDGLPGLTRALLTRTFERLFFHLLERVRRTHTPQAAVRALVDAHLEWVFDNPDEARVMYQAMTLDLGRDAEGTLAEAKAQLLKPIAAHLAGFSAGGGLPRWSPTLLDITLLGVSHEACRRYLGGARLDPAWLRRKLPILAWKSVAGGVSD